MPTLIKSLISFLYLSFIIYEYWIHHPNYKKAVSEPACLFFIASVSIIYLGYFLYSFLANKKTKVTIRLSAWRCFLIFSVSVFFIFNFLILSNPSYIYTGPNAYKLSDTTLFLHTDEAQPVPDGATIFVKKYDKTKPTDQLPDSLKKYSETFSFWKTQKSLLFNLSVTFIEWVILLTWMYALGTFFYKRYLPRSSNDCLFSLGIGFFAIVLMLFIFAACHVLNTYSALAFLLLSALVFHKNCRDFLSLFFRRFKAIELHFLSLEVLFCIILLSFLSLNFISNIRTFPFGWDAAEKYLNVPNLLAQKHQLIGGNQPYYYELFVSLGFNSFRGIVSALSVYFLTTILAFTSVFVLFRRFLSTQSSLILTCVFYTLPMVFFQIHIDPKPDMAMLFVANLSLLATFKWMDGRRRNTGDNRFLYLAFLLAGFAFGIKYTALFFVLALLAVVSFEFFSIPGLVAAISFSFLVLLQQGSILFFKDIFIQNKTLFSLIAGALFLISFGFICFKKTILPILICLIFLSIPVLPWMIKGAYENKSLSLNSMLQGKDERPVVDFASLGIDDTKCTQSGFEEDYQRYLGFDSEWKNYLYLPWNLTMNVHRKGILVDIGFVFLAFLPLAILFFNKKIINGVHFRHLLVFGLLFWFYWLLCSSGVVWYGLLGFPFFFILMGYVFEQGETGSVSNKWVFSIILIFWCLSSFSLRYKSSNDSVSMLLYSAGAIDKETSLNLVVPGHDFFNDTFTKDKSPENKYLFRIATPYAFFISDNHRRIISDQLLDTFSCINQEEDPRLTIERLKKMGVKYILLDNFLPRLRQTSEKTLTKKYDKFVEFSKSLTLLYKTPFFRNTTFYRVE